MKQTAVEWLVESLSIHFTFEQQMQFEGLFQQAKEMEEKQIIDAYKEGMCNVDGWIVNENGIEEYYNETYENKETVSKLLEFIRTEPRLEQVQDGFLYHGFYFTNEQLIQMFYERINSINNSLGSTERNIN